MLADLRNTVVVAELATESLNIAAWDWECANEVSELVRCAELWQGPVQQIIICIWSSTTLYDCEVLLRIVNQNLRSVQSQTESDREFH